ncbi:hypothetical protein [Ktedonospora formicarum]|uniref:Protein kinase domain-containing protein n=1 Tax=Ktedonospora formicarum TaxID=2778364 RepID=A0A8J3MT74_9CHLR|nr:hypothetical protein [Ktedonospora formicarum]GHO47922.1 hypothetical protein KSX_60850 [Ktedonospora formicarum]
MKVRLDGKIVTLQQKDVIGSGGEGMVFRLEQKGQSLAVKLYHTPTPEHERKLLSLTTRAWSLPGEIIAVPGQIVRDVNADNVIGLAMPYFGAPVAEVALLANKRQRAARAISTRQVCDIFLSAGQALLAIHSAGLVVGDLNDQNLLFREREALWIDVDAWQFDTFPCPVACEDYLAPELYGVDLSLHPAFAPEHDWYAFAVLLFRSLLLVHPYGGTYPQLPLLTQRATQGVFVLQSEVTYPKFAYTPELVNEALLSVFERYFRQGWRGTFPLTELEEYRASLITCHACKQDFPGERQTCPHCQVRTQSITRVASMEVGGVKCEELMRTEGSIVFHALAGGTLTVVAYEQGNAVLYRKRPLAPLERFILFKAIPGAQYALVGDTLIVNPAYSTRLLCLDISGDSPRPLYQSATSLFSGSKQAIFQGSPTHLYAILNHALVASQVEESGISSRSLRVVMDEQTWFSASRLGICILCSATSRSSVSNSSGCNMARTRLSLNSRPLRRERPCSISQPTSHRKIFYCAA